MNKKTPHKFQEKIDLTYERERAGTFGLYRYPAKFIPHVVAYVLDNYGSKSMKIGAQR